MQMKRFMKIYEDESFTDYSQEETIALTVVHFSYKCIAFDIVQCIVCY